MKKIISLILLLTIALSLCACGNKNIQPRFVGTWESNDGTVKLTLNADGTATFVKTYGDDAGTYNFLWVAENNANITIKWDGEPIPALKVEEEVDGTTPAVEEATEAVVTDATGEAVEGAADGTTGSTTTKRDDPSVVGFGFMTVDKGEMVMALSEGSTADILLFVFNVSNKKVLKKVA